VSLPGGLQAAMITILCTQALDLGMIILVNVAVNPAIYAVKLQVAKCKNMPNDHKKLLMTQSYRE